MRFVYWSFAFKGERSSALTWICNFRISPRIAALLWPHWLPAPVLTLAMNATLVRRPCASCSSDRHVQPISLAPEGRSSTMVAVKVLMGAPNTSKIRMRTSTAETGSLDVRAPRARRLKRSPANLSISCSGATKHVTSWIGAVESFKTIARRCNVDLTLTTGLPSKSCTVAAPPSMSEIDSSRKGPEGRSGCPKQRLQAAIVVKTDVLRVSMLFSLLDDEPLPAYPSIVCLIDVAGTVAGLDIRSAGHAGEDRRGDPVPDRHKTFDLRGEYQHVFHVTLRDEIGAGKKNELHRAWYRSGAGFLCSSPSFFRLGDPMENHDILLHRRNRFSIARLKDLIQHLMPGRILLLSYGTGCLFFPRCFLACQIPRYDTTHEARDIEPVQFKFGIELSPGLLRDPKGYLLRFFSHLRAIVKRSLDNLLTSSLLYSCIQCQ